MENFQNINTKILFQCGKGTDFSYGPWADRQREHLLKFFFPQDYQNLEVSYRQKTK